MGFFGPTAQEKAAVDTFLMEKFSTGELLSDIIASVSKFSRSKDYTWLTCARNYYDNRQRCVIIDTNGILIMNCSLDLVKKDAALHASAKRASLFGSAERFAEKAAAAEASSKALADIESFYIDYTMLDYTPLPSQYESQTHTVSGADLLALWTKAVLQRVTKCAPSLKFSTPIVLNGYQMFSYVVPALEWKQWF